jgi:hypothetical protein
MNSLFPDESTQQTRTYESLPASMQCSSAGSETEVADERANVRELSHRTVLPHGAMTVL